MHNRIGKPKKIRGIIGFAVGFCLVMGVGFHTLGIGLIFQIESVVIYSVLAFVIGAFGYGVASGVESNNDRTNNNDDEHFARKVEDISLPTFDDGSAYGSRWKFTNNGSGFTR